MKAISIGHTLRGKGTGAVGKLNEGICTRDIGERVKSILESRGEKIVYCRVDESYNDLSYRVSLANESGAALFVEIHLNAGGGHGVEIYTYGAKEIPEARAVLNNIVSLGFTNRGIKDGSHLYVIRNTNMPAMLIECCFVDSEEDYNLYNADKIALAISNGLTGEIKEQPNVINPQKVEIPVQAPNNSYDGYITGDDIKMLQAEVNKQFKKGLAIDGLPGTNTFNALKDVIVKKGARGNITFIIQRMLLRKGYKLPRFGADCDFGNETAESLKQFQLDNGLVPDMIVGINTWKKLLEV